MLLGQNEGYDKGRGLASGRVLEIGLALSELTLSQDGATLPDNAAAELVTAAQADDTEGRGVEGWGS